MGALWLSLVIFGIVLGVGVAGVLRAPTLAAPALGDFNAREFFKAIRAIVIGVTSLSLGLLVTNAKSDFQKHRDELRAQATNVIVLDRILRDYGPDADQARSELASSIRNEIRQIDLAARDLITDAKAFGTSHMGRLRSALIRLEPTTDGQRWLKTAALTKAQDVVGSRWRIYEDLDGNIIWPVVGAVVFWLVATFFSIGVIMPRHSYAVGGLVIGVFSVAIALFLIIELSYPYDGMITISPRPLEDAVAEISGLPPAVLVKLGEKGVKTLEDLADLAGDELIETLGAEVVDEETANAIVMEARRRAGWLGDEDAVAGPEA